MVDASSRNWAATAATLPGGMPRSTRASRHSVSCSAVVGRGTSIATVVLSPARTGSRVLSTTGEASASINRATAAARAPSPASRSSPSM
jgi:hypothetical protein